MLFSFACLYLLQMEEHSARYSSHHDCSLIPFELSVGQMVKWVIKVEHMGAGHDSGAFLERPFVNKLMSFPNVTTLTLVYENSQRQCTVSMEIS